MNDSIACTELTRPNCVAFALQAFCFYGLIDIPIFTHVNAISFYTYTHKLQPHSRRVRLEWKTNNVRVLLNNSWNILMRRLNNTSATNIILYLCKIHGPPHYNSNEKMKYVSNATEWALFSTKCIGINCYPFVHVAVQLFRYAIGFGFKVQQILIELITSKTDLI